MASGRATEGDRGPGRTRWRAIAVGVRDGMRTDRLTLVAAGVAFYAMMSLVPALAALVAVYGLFSDPADITRQVEAVTRAVPSEVSDLIVEQLTHLSATARTSLGIGAVIAIIVALWSASAGVQALLDGVAVAFGEGVSANYIERRGRALLVTLGAVVLAAVALALVVALPVWAQNLPGDSAGQLLTSVLRWPILAVLVSGTLTFLYRTASRQGTQRGWLTPGAVLGTGVWLAASAGLSFYVTRFGRYTSYGSLGTVLVLLLWLWVTAIAILAGARFDLELQRAGAAPRDQGP